MSVQTVFHPENLVEKKTYKVKLRSKFKDIGVFWGFQRLMAEGSMRLFAEFRTREDHSCLNFVVPVWQIESADPI